MPSELITESRIDVPASIRAAGKRAVNVYREFLDDPKWSSNTGRQ